MPNNGIILPPKLNFKLSSPNSPTKNLTGKSAQIVNKNPCINDEKTNENQLNKMSETANQKTDTVNGTTDTMANDALSFLNNTMNNLANSGSTNAQTVSVPILNPTNTVPTAVTLTNTSNSSPVVASSPHLYFTCLNTVRGSVVSTSSTQMSTATATGQISENIAPSVNSQTETLSTANVIPSKANVTSSAVNVIKSAVSEPSTKVTMKKPTKTGLRMRKFANIHTNCSTSNRFDALDVAVLEDCEEESIVCENHDSNDMEVDGGASPDETLIFKKSAKRGHEQVVSPAESTNGDTITGKMAKLADVAKQLNQIILPKRTANVNTRPALNNAGKSPKNVNVGASTSTNAGRNNQLAKEPSKSKKYPEIVVTMDRDACSALLTDINCNIAYHVKPASMESRFYAHDELSHTTIKQVFKSKGVPFYSHALYGRTKLRVILSRCFQTDANDIKMALTACGRRPVAVRPMGSPKNPKFGIDFEKGVTTLKDLQSNCSLMNHQSVKWELSQSTSKGPTVCYRCSMIGHGAAECERSPVCPYCEQEHIMINCPIKDAAEKHSCVNCRLRSYPDTAHAATDRKCKSQLDYSEDRLKWRTESMKKKGKGAHKSTVNDIKNIDWAIPQEISPSKINKFPNSSPELNHSPTAGPLKRRLQYASAVRLGRSRAASATRQSNDEEIVPDRTHQSGELFELSELFAMLTEAIDELMTAPSRLHQMQICMRLLQQCL